MNLLSTATSAYLRSAAHQPVHWREWGEPAFAAAAELDRPILLDIGAVWCHWCHVMDGESYEDPALAEFLNEHFVCIKVDRDERPDVDLRYQRAVQALSGQGGWPLTACLLPDGQVFFGGTYFPPDGRYGRPGFRAILQRVLDAYHGNREQIEERALAVRRHLADRLIEAQPGLVTSAMLEEAVQAIGRAHDPVHGGFGGAPKFPHPTTILFLLSRWADGGAPIVREIVENTLRGMARGGIHDHLGGGFHRYSTDAEWIVPHFEKMAYDNSELLRCYVEAAAAFGSADYADVARGIIRWVRETGSDPEGGYLTSQDADVGLDDDGDYFTWTVEEASSVLSPDEFEVAAARFDIGTAGEMHHNPSKNVLYLAANLSQIAARTGRSVEGVDALLRAAQAKLLAARQRRTAPYVDRTRYTNWNAMLASALLRAAPVLGDDWAGDHALLTLRRIRRESPGPDRVAHVPGGDDGTLDDQVHVAMAALDAFEATADRAWLDWSLRLMDSTWREYWDPGDGGFFDRTTDAAGPGLLSSRVKPIEDAPTPSANGVAAIACARLHELTGDPVWATRRDAVVNAFAGRIAELTLYASALLLAADWVLNPATHLLVAGPDADPLAAEMHRAALAAFAPRRVVRRVSPGDNTEGVPRTVAGLLAAAAPTRGFACKGATCTLPATTMKEWSRTLADFLRPGFP